MRIGFSSSCAIGLAIALTLGGVSTVQAQQKDSTRRTTRSTSQPKRKATSSKRIPITKESPGEVAPTPTVNQDSIAARIVALQEQTKVADRQIDVARTDLDNTIIRAPFSGVAISKDAQPGEMVSPVSAGGGFTRTGICTIVDMRSLEVEVDVNETYINRVEPGQKVLVTLNAYPDWQIPGHVITPVPTGDRQKATVLVRIAFEKLDVRILPDMGIKVAFLRDDAKATAKGGAAVAPARPVALVPKGAIKTDGGQAYVWVLKDDTVERRAVTTGGTDGDQIEVLLDFGTAYRYDPDVPPKPARGTPGYHSPQAAHPDWRDDFVAGLVDVFMVLGRSKMGLEVAEGVAKDAHHHAVNQDERKRPINNRY